MVYKDLYDEIHLIYECKEPAQHNIIWYTEIEHKGQRMYMEYDKR